MKILIQTPGFKASKKLQNLVTEKLDKLSELYPRILEARVVLRLDKSEDQKNKICEVIIVIRGNDLFASRKTESFEESLSKVVTALKRQLSVAKDKPKSVKKAAAKKTAKIKK